MNIVIFREWERGWSEFPVPFRLQNYFWLVTVYLSVTQMYNDSYNIILLLCVFISNRVGFIYEQYSTSKSKGLSINF